MFEHKSAGSSAPLPPELDRIPIDGPILSDLVDRGFLFYSIYYYIILSYYNDTTCSHPKPTGVTITLQMHPT